MILVQVKSERITIPIGKQGEHRARKVVFDVSDWYENGIERGGEFAALHQREGDTDFYPIVVTASEDGNEVFWIVEEADVAKGGIGRCQLTYYVNETRAKNEIYRTFTAESMIGEGEAPEPYQNWVDNVMEASHSAHQSANEASASAAIAETAKEAAENSADEAEAQADYAAGIMGLAVFEIDTETGLLTVVYPTPYYGATFEINNSGMLEVTT